MWWYNPESTTMPEGDTLFRIAATLRKALLDRSVIRFESRIPEVAEIDRRMPVAGRSVSAVEARGKHLLIVLRFAEAGESEPTPGRTQGVPGPGRGEDHAIVTNTDDPGLAGSRGLSP